MKTFANQRSARGMTLHEVAFVIMVLLSLFSIVFIGSRAWMRGSDRSGCILNIRNAQIAVRAYQDVRGLPVGTPINMSTDLIGQGKFFKTNPQCSGGGCYHQIGHIPSLGELALSCSLSGNDAHVPADSSDW
ncbi:MAG: hypothetical protein ABIT37_24605 [Luteolibacter sp.]